MICSLTSYSNSLYMPLFNVPILLNLLVNSAVPFVNPLAFCYGDTRVDRTRRFYSFLSDLSTVFIFAYLVSHSKAFSKNINVCGKQTFT